MSGSLVRLFQKTAQSLQPCCITQLSEIPNSPEQVTCLNNSNDRTWSFPVQVLVSCSNQVQQTLVPTNVAMGEVSDPALIFKKDRLLLEGSRGALTKEYVEEVKLQQEIHNLRKELRSHMSDMHSDADGNQVRSNKVQMQKESYSQSEKDGLSSTVVQNYSHKRQLYNISVEMHVKEQKSNCVSLPKGNSNGGNALLRKYFSRWKNFIQITKQQDNEAHVYWKTKLTRRCLQTWREYTQVQVSFREIQKRRLEVKSRRMAQVKAGKYYRISLLNKYWQIWKNCVTERRAMCVLSSEAAAMHNKVDSFLKNLENPKAVNRDIKLSRDGHKCGSARSGIVKRRYAQVRVENMTGSLEDLHASDIGMVHRSLCATSTGSLVNRFHAQKSIIEKQKAELAEQKKLIGEFKLSQLRTETTESMNKATLATKTMKKSKTIEESSSFLEEQKAPVFVLKMEERAKERAERRRELKARREKFEEEKVKRIQEMAEEKVRKEEEERRQKIQEAQKKRELEKLGKLRREQDIEREKLLTGVADAHNKNRLLHTYGISPWKKYVQQIQEKCRQASDLYRTKLLRKTVSTWRSYTVLQIEVKMNGACAYFNKKLMAETFYTWLQQYHEHLKQLQTAEDYYELCLQDRIFTAWHSLVCRIHCERSVKMDIAERHYNRKLMFRCLLAWKCFPALLQEERQRERRRDVWRKKVLEVVPDFVPRSLEENE